MSESNADRVAFEAKVAFLERAVEILTESVQEQGKTMHEFEERFAKLERKLSDQADSEGVPMRPHDDPPPHY